MDNHAARSRSCAIHVEVAQPAGRDYQPDHVDIGFAVLILLAWTMLEWFGRGEHGRLPLALAGVAALCVLFSYSVALTGSTLRLIRWALPRRPWYWLAGISSGTGGAGALVLFLRLTRNPPLTREPHLAAVVLAITVGPILEEIIFRGLILSGLIYLSKSLPLPRNVNVWLSIIAAALLFGFAHSGRTGTPLIETTLMGMIYGWLRVESQSTAVSAAAHSSFNLVLTLLAH